MIRINQLKFLAGYQREDIIHKIAKQFSIQEKDILAVKIVRESIDARKKPDVFYQLSVDVTVSGEDKIFKAYQKRQHDRNVSLVDPKPYCFPECGNIGLKKKPVIIGTGPAGLFCGYYLALRGFQPILLERGSQVEKRKAAIETYWQSGVLNPECNVQFGEGGAGTFSDGKLNTLTKDKSGRNHEVLRLFVKMGAKESILYEQKPHLGTDVLFEIIRKMREEIIRLGGTFFFDTKAEEILVKDGKLFGVRLGDDTVIETEHCVLATGHSARDTFLMLQKKGISMEAKSFAVGFRLQHPQEMIDRMQYGSAKDQFPPASYKVTAKAGDGRGVYSFCMCPGGYVVNASSEEGHLAVNGMSYSKRDGKNANSAIIISVTPEDYPEKGALGGISFQRMIEKRAYELCSGKIPVQLYGDFVKNIPSIELGDIAAEMKGEYALSNLRGILPEALNQAFMEGMEQLGHKIKGFDRADAVMAGIESRTSSPVRIHRDERLMSNVYGLYPCGEGAGYAGGITSAAADGIFVAEQITKTFFPDRESLEA